MMPGSPYPICLWLAWACASVRLPARPSCLPARTSSLVGVRKYPLPYPYLGVNPGAGIAGVHPIPGIAGDGVCCAGCVDGAGCAVCAACSSCSLLCEFQCEIELLRPPYFSMRVKVSDGELYRARYGLGNWIFLPVSSRLIICACKRCDSLIMMQGVVM